MAENKLIKDIKAFAGSVKLTSNITTIILVLWMAYTINEWHSIYGFDRLINLLIMTLIIFINIKFYLIYSNISSYDHEKEALTIEYSYKEEKRAYYSLLRASLWMSIILFIGKLFM